MEPRQLSSQFKPVAVELKPPVVEQSSSQLKPPVVEYLYAAMQLWLKSKQKKIHQKNNSYEGSSSSDQINVNFLIEFATDRPFDDKKVLTLMPSEVRFSFENMFNQDIVAIESLETELNLKFPIEKATQTNIILSGYAKTLMLIIERLKDDLSNELNKYIVINDEQRKKLEEYQLNNLEDVIYTIIEGYLLHLLAKMMEQKFQGQPSESLDRKNYALFTRLLGKSIINYIKNTKAETDLYTEFLKVMEKHITHMNKSGSRQATVYFTFKQLLNEEVLAFVSKLVKADEVKVKKGEISWLNQYKTPSESNLLFDLKFLEDDALFKKFCEIGKLNKNEISEYKKKIDELKKRFKNQLNPNNVEEKEPSLISPTGGGLVNSVKKRIRETKRAIELSLKPTSVSQEGEEEIKKEIKESPQESSELKDKQTASTTTPAFTAVGPSSLVANQGLFGDGGSQNPLINGSDDAEQETRLVRNRSDDIVAAEATETKKNSPALERQIGTRSIKKNYGL